MDTYRCRTPSCRLARWQLRCAARGARPQRRGPSRSRSLACGRVTAWPARCRSYRAPEIPRGIDSNQMQFVGGYAPNPALESCWRQLGVADRVLDVLVAQVGLQGARVSAGIRLVDSTGVPEHVRVRLDFELGGLASPVDELLEVADRHRRAAFGHEQEG